MKKSIRKILSLLIVFNLSFATITEGFALTEENEEKKRCEECVQLIENALSDNLVNNDVYETKKAIIADGYSAKITIPKNGNNAIEVSDGKENSLEFELPKEAKGGKGLLTEKGTVIYNCDNDVSIAVQPLTDQVGDAQIDSVRALVAIANDTAPHEYEFKFNLKSGEKLVSAKEYLGDDYDTGEAFVVDSDNRIISVIDSAWAKDSKGRSVNTHYETRGNTLVQVVDFDKTTSFPVVADPTAWQVTKCAGSITWVIGSSIFAVAKVAKIKKYIKTLGGIKKSASKLIGIVKKAQKIAKKNKTSTINVLRKKKYSKKLWEGVGSTLVNFGSAVLGVDAVIEQCSF